MRPRWEPLEEFTFAARLGFLSKTLWKEFFAEGSQSWRDKCWRNMPKTGMFLKNEGLPNLLYPNPDCPFANQVAIVSSPPSLNQLFHDEMVARTALLILKGAPTAEIAFEQEMKKVEPINNKGRPISEQRKHPDLILEIGGVRIAVEIELTVKSNSRYRVALASVQKLDVDYVVYVITSDWSRTAVLKAARSVSYPDQRVPLGFASLKDWRQNPFETDVNFRNKSCVLSDLVQSDSKTISAGFSKSV